MEHLDISAVHSLPWAVRLPMARRVADALSADATVCDLRVEQGAPPDETVVHFSVLARTHAEALELVLASERRAYDAAGSGRDPGRPPEDLSAAFETAWNPYDDIRPLDESLTRP